MERQQGSARRRALSRRAGPDTLAANPVDRRSLHLADLEVCLFGEARPAGRRLEFHDERAAAAFVARQMADARDAHVLRALAGELDFGAGVADDRDVVARLASALVAGRVSLVRPTAAPEPLVGPPGDEQEDRPDADDFDARQKPPPTDWIEIQLVDEDGQGIPGQRYVIVAPDGVEWRGFTDSLGVARLSRIPAGACTVSFPDLDAEAWEPW